MITNILLTLLISFCILLTFSVNFSLGLQNDARKPIEKFSDTIRYKNSTRSEPFVPISFDNTHKKNISIHQNNPNKSVNKTEIAEDENPFLNDLLTEQSIPRLENTPELKSDKTNITEILNLTSNENQKIKTFVISNFFKSLNLTAIPNKTLKKIYNSLARKNNFTLIKNIKEKDNFQDGHSFNYKFDHKTGDYSKTTNFTSFYRNNQCPDNFSGIPNFKIQKVGSRRNPKYQFIYKPKNKLSSNNKTKYLGLQDLIAFFNKNNVSDQEISEIIYTRNLINTKFIFNNFRFCYINKIYLKSDIEIIFFKNKDIIISQLSDRNVNLYNLNNFEKLENHFYNVCIDMPVTCESRENCCEVFALKKSVNKMIFRPYNKKKLNFETIMCFILNTNKMSKKHIEKYRQYKNKKMKNKTRRRNRINRIMR